ncbi:MAG TPA: hypothetical protein VFI05_12445 [Nitrospiraceae bacterium]|nr:hypothetical protein [Nitrospiraceae bacterium]
MQTQAMHINRMVVAGVCGLWLIMMAGTVWGQGTWVEEVGNSLAFYQTVHPDSDWMPYIDELTRARDGVRSGNQLTVTRAMRELQKMLRTRAHGIDGAAAEDLYNLTLTIRPSDEQPFAEGNELELGRERLMSVPAQTILTPNGGKVRCHEGGCDYWLDHAFDPGSG